MKISNIYEQLEKIQNILKIIPRTENDKILKLVKIYSVYSYLLYQQIELILSKTGFPLKFKKNVFLFYWWWVLKIYNFILKSTIYIQFSIKSHPQSCAYFKVVKSLYRQKIIFKHIIITMHSSLHLESRSPFLRGGGRIHLCCLHFTNVYYAYHIKLCNINFKIWTLNFPCYSLVRLSQHIHAK